MERVKAMTYKEHYGTIENKIKEEAKMWLEDIEKDGYLYYSESYCKHIDLLTKPECYMTDKEKEAKEKALKHIEELKQAANGNVVITPLQLAEWEFLKDKEFPSWGVRKDG